MANVSPLCIGRLKYRLWTQIEEEYYSYKTVNKASNTESRKNKIFQFFHIQIEIP